MFILLICHRNIRPQRFLNFLRKLQAELDHAIQKLARTDGQLRAAIEDRVKDQALSTETITQLEGRMLSLQALHESHTKTMDQQSRAFDALRESHGRLEEEARTANDKVRMTEEI